MKAVIHFFLLQQYFVKDKQGKTDEVAKPIEVKDVEKPKEAASKEAVVEKTVEETTPVAPAVTEENSEATPPAEESTKEQSSVSTQEENSGDQDAAEEIPQIKVTFI